MRKRVTPASSAHLLEPPRVRLLILNACLGQLERGFSQFTLATKMERGGAAPILEIDNTSSHLSVSLPTDAKEMTRAERGLSQFTLATKMERGRRLQNPVFASQQRHAPNNQKDRHKGAQVARSSLDSGRRLSCGRCSSGARRGASSRGGARTWR
jgi:hypothetical protein